MVIVGGGLALLLLVIAIAVLLATRGSGALKGSAPPAPVGVASPAASPMVAVAAPTVATPTSSEMENVLQRYVNAYTNEDLSGLQSLFAADLVRTNGTGPSEDLTQALDTYQSQFDALSSPVYRLSSVTYDTLAATAVGTYSISSDAGKVGGSIAFHFVRVGDQALIDTIVIEPFS